MFVRAKTVRSEDMALVFGSIITEACGGVFVFV